VSEYRVKSNKPTTLEQDAGDAVKSIAIMVLLFYPLYLGVEWSMRSWRNFFIGLTWFIGSIIIFGIISPGTQPITGNVDYNRPLPMDQHSLRNFPEATAELQRNLAADQARRDFAAGRTRQNGRLEETMSVTNGRSGSAGITVHR